MLLGPKIHPGDPPVSNQARRQRPRHWFHLVIPVAFVQHPLELRGPRRETIADLVSSKRLLARSAGQVVTAASAVAASCSACRPRPS
jgi:hypothetical protein